MEKKTSEQIRKELAAPFEEIGADKKTHPTHKWRVQSSNSYGTLCIPYIDSRQVVDRLNNVLGIDGWSNNLIEMSGKGLICEIVAIIGDKEISKSNVGTETKVEKEKGQASDAIKRAATAFGVGSYLYEMEPVKLKTVIDGGKSYPATEKGIALKTGDALTSYINLMHPLRSKLNEIYKSIPKAKRSEIDKEFKAIWTALTD